MKLTPSITKAARAMLGWRASDLCEKSGVSHDAQRGFEAGRTKTLSFKNQQALIEALQDAGLTLIPENGGGAGVRFTAPTKQGPDN